MKWFRVLSILALVALIADSGGVQPAAAQTTAALAAEARPPFVPGEVLVAFKEGQSAAAYKTRAAALAGQTGSEVAASYQNLALLSFDVSADVEALTREIAGQPGVVSTQVNYVYSLYREVEEIQAAPYQAPAYQIETADGQTKEIAWAEAARMRTRVRRGSYYKTGTTLPKELSEGNTWAWDFIQADVIWDSPATSPDVCLLDTGVDQKHPDLGTTKVINGYDFINFDTVANDDNGHGTHLAGILAAVNNNITGSTMGVSNGKVMAVKVLNAEGRGTTFSVSAGIRFCAEKPTVKVINLSIEGWWPDQAMYDNLDIAINHPPVVAGNKPKLVVASAGNWGSSDKSIPAAWSAPYFLRDPNDPGSYNNIHQGLISVAGANSPMSNDGNVNLWVDTNGDHKWWFDENNDNQWNGWENEDVQWDEVINRRSCAARFTNYGQWVDIVAPAESIYSTTPVSYPFYEGYYHGMSKSYGWMQGTSQAAAYVSGAAARTWSVNPAFTNAQIKERLHDYSTQRVNRIRFAVDPNASNADQGYNSPIDGMIEYEPKYGDTFWTPFDNYTVRAPYCWPVQGGHFEAPHDMGEATYLNVAGTMDRFGLMSTVMDSHSALPIVGTTISFYNGGPTGSANTLLGSGVLQSGDSPFVSLTNQAVPAVPTHFKTNANKSGYTSGNQKVLDFVASDSVRGWYWMDAASIPPLSNNLEFTLSWWSDHRLGMMLWLPEQTSPDPQNIVRDGVVSPIWMPGYQPVFPDWMSREEGTLATYAQTGIPEEPFAQMVHDGVNNGENISSLVIRGAPLGSLYSRPHYQGTYSLYVTDYSRGYNGGQISLGRPGLNTSSEDFANPTVNLWSRGKLMRTYTLDMDPDGGPYSSCADGDQDLWHVADLTWNGAAFTYSTDDPAGSEECGSLDTNASGGFDFVPYPADQNPRVIASYPTWEYERDPLERVRLVFSEPVTLGADWMSLFCNDGSGERPITTTSEMEGMNIVSIEMQSELHLNDSCSLDLNPAQVTAANDPSQTAEDFYLRYHIVDRAPRVRPTSIPYFNQNLTDLVAPFSIMMSEPVDTDDGWVELTCDSTGNIPVNHTAWNDALTLTVTHDELPANTNCLLTIFGSAVLENDLNYGDQLGLEGNLVINFTTYQP